MLSLCEHFLVKNLSKWDQVTLFFKTLHFTQHKSFQWLTWPHGELGFLWSLESHISYHYLHCSHTPATLASPILQPCSQAHLRPCFLLLPLLCIPQELHGLQISIHTTVSEGPSDTTLYKTGIPLSTTLLSSPYSALLSYIYSYSIY